MRINVQCNNQKCGIPYTLQMADGIGTVGVTITCPCGNVINHQFDVPAQEGELVWIVATDTIKSSEKLS